MRWSITRENDLLIELMKRVEDMKELILRLLSARKELHVINKEQINLLIDVLEGIHGLIPDRLDQFIGKAL